MPHSDIVVRPEPFVRLKEGFLFCKVDEILNPGSKEFLFEGSNNEVLSIFIVRSGENTHAYVNRCPHAGMRLNYKPHDFLTEDNAEIICHNHGAVFSIKDGVCTQGPCVNYALQSVPIRIENGKIFATKDTTQSPSDGS